MLAFRNVLEAVAGGGIPYALDATAASIRDAILDPASYASGGWRLPGIAGARLSASARASVAMQQRVDGAWEFAPHNLLQRSDDFANAYWTKINGTATANRLTASSGGTTYATNPGTMSLSPQPVTVRLRAKAGTTPWIGIQVSDNTANAAGKYVNLATGLIGASQAGLGSAFAMSASALLNADGTTDCTITFTLTVAASSYSIYLYLASADGTLTVAAGQYVDLSWINFNLGPAPTAYVPTTTTAVYGPAIDWLSGIGAYGLRSEEARTNLVLWSADMSNAAWQVFGTGATKVGAGTALGAMPMYRVNVGSVGGAAGASAVFQSVTVAATTTYTASVVARSISGTSPFRLWYDSGGGPLVSGDLVATTAAQTFTFTFTTTATVTSANVAVRAAFAGGVVGDIEVGGFQLEQGAFATSPILTYGAAATRAADDITGTLISPTIGTYVFDYFNAVDTQALRTLVNHDNGSTYTAPSGFLIRLETSRQVAWGGNTLANNTANQGATGALNKVAVAFQVGGSPEYAVSLNGGTVATLASSDYTGVGSTRLRLGNGANGPLSGHIVRARYVTRRMTNAQLQALTA